MFTGVLITCSVIGNLTNFVSNMDSSGARFQQKLDNMEKYLAFRGVPQELQESIKHYYNFTWTMLQGIDEEEILNELPCVSYFFVLYPHRQRGSMHLSILTPTPFVASRIPLRIQVSGLFKQNLLKNVEFFWKTSPTFLNALTDIMEHQVYSPGNVIIEKRRPAKAVYIL